MTSSSNVLVRCSLVLLLMGSIAGCNSAQHNTDESDDTIVEIREVPTFDGEESEVYVWYDRSLIEVTRKYLTPTICEILGYVKDYGRCDLKESDDDFVEHFYPSEKDQAEKFLSLLEAFAEETRVSTEIKREVRSGEGEHITFRSRELARIINSFYAKDSESGFYGIDLDIFANPHPEYALHFLRGAHCRYGVKGRNMFHVSYKDSDTIIAVLEGLHCDNIRAVQTFSLMPGSATILFRPTDTVKEFLGIEKYVNIFLEDTDPNDRDLATDPWIWGFEEED